MNNKYHLSTDRSIDRTPESNKESILNRFKEKIPINAASIIISRNITTLFEANRILEQNNWTRFDNKFRNFNSANKVNYNNTNRYYQQNNDYTKQSGTVRRNSNTTHNGITYNRMYIRNIFNEIINTTCKGIICNRTHSQIFNIAHTNKMDINQTFKRGHNFQGQTT